MDENINKGADVNVADKLVSVEEQTTNQAPKLKTCLYCGETILATARKSEYYSCACKSYSKTKNI